MIFTQTLFLKLIYLIISLIIGFSILSSCTQKSITNENTSVFSTFEKYAKLLNKKQEYSNTQREIIFSRYSKRYQIEILNTRKKTPEILQHLIISYLSFPQLLKTKINHFESIKNNEACLVINGKSIDNEKIAFYLTLMKTNEWKIDSMVIEYMMDSNQYISSANCSKKFRNELRFKEMM